MTMLNDSNDKIRSMVSSEIYGSQNGYLEHHGVSGMKWGVRSAETLRKYGLLTGAKARAAARAAAAKLRKSKEQAEDKAKQTGRAAASLAKAKASGMVASKKKAMADHAALKKQEKADNKVLDEHRKEMGLSKSQFKKMRKTALESDDPKTVAKNSKALTDDELKVKVRRLDDIQRINSLDTTRKTAKAKMWDARMEALKKSPINSLLIDPASKVTSSIITEQLYGAGLKPLIDQRVVWNKNNAEEAYASSHTGAKQSKESKDQASAIKAEREAVAARRKAAQEAVREKVINIGSKASTSLINSAQQRASTERGKARLTEERISDAQKQFDHFNSVVEEGRKRNAAQTNIGNGKPSETKPNSYNTDRMGKYEPKKSSPVDNLRPINERSERTASKERTDYTQRTRKPDVYDVNVSNITPGIIDAKVVSSSTRSSSKAASATRSSSVYKEPVSSTTDEQRRGQIVLARMS